MNTRYYTQRFKKSDCVEIFRGEYAGLRGRVIDAKAFVQEHELLDINSAQYGYLSVYDFEVDYVAGSKMFIHVRIGKYEGAVGKIWSRKKDNIYLTEYTVITTDETLVRVSEAVLQPMSNAMKFMFF